LSNLLEKKVTVAGANDGVSFLLLSVGSDMLVSRKLIMGPKYPVV